MSEMVRPRYTLCDAVRKAVQDLVLPGRLLEAQSVSEELKNVSVSTGGLIMALVQAELLATTRDAMQVLTAKH